MRRIGSAIPITGAAQQDVHDATASLLVRRAELAVALSAGQRVDAEVVATGLSDLDGWMHDTSAGARELLSASSAGHTDQLQRSLPLTRTRLANGLKLVSLWDYWRSDHEAKVLLANEDHGSHLFGLVPVPMKIVDRSFVLLQGPASGDDVSLMKVWDPTCLQLAWRFWRAAMATTVPFHPRPTSATGFSTRQHQVLSLLAADLSDDAVAAALGISVRTVRADVAAVLQALGVKSRFAAGVRLNRWGEDGSD